MCAVPTKVFAPATTWHPLSSCIRSSTAAMLLSACYRTTHEVAHNSHLEFCAWLLTSITYKPQTSSCTYEWILSVQTLDHSMHLLMGCRHFQPTPSLQYHISCVLYVAPKCTWLYSHYSSTNKFHQKLLVEQFTYNHCSTCSLRHALKSKYFLFYCKYCISDKHFLHNEAAVSRTDSVQMNHTLECTHLRPCKYRWWRSARVKNTTIHCSIIIFQFQTLLASSLDQLLCVAVVLTNKT
jgi:hypothetical protein